MKRAERTYALPPRTVETFETALETGKRSRVAAELIERFAKYERWAALRRDIDEGCQEMWDFYRDVTREWESADDAPH